MFHAAFWKRAFTSELYVTVLVAIVLGAAFGLLWPKAGASLEPLGDVFIAAIQMLIGPVVFCTIVTGIASAGQLASVGRVGVKALIYFETVTTIALITGLVVMNVFAPGASLNASPGDLKLSDAAKGFVTTAHGEHWYDFLVGIVPESAIGAFTAGSVLQVLFVAIVFAIALRGLGERAAPITAAIERLGEVVFGMVGIVMLLAPFGAFGAMAFAVGKFGLDTLQSLASFVALFWATGIAFSLIVFGVVARLVGINVPIGDPAMPLLHPDARLDPEAARLLRLDELRQLDDTPWGFEPSAISRAAPLCLVAGIVGATVGYRLTKRS